ncbi:copper transporter [Peptostreptococcus stomatis]|uniref:copper transporter n=1 Tax=Peptostreptococcus stomatis TaxID=341694 RepID=UPI001A38E555|nr:copper transporter [Peptostreptococcus stomatis]MBL6466332.1 copper transporter [Peptostreptococcus stomatis]
MHINFKYFIVSIGAIFLALGVGILIGTSMGSSVDIQEQNAAIVTDIDKQFKQLKEKDDKLAETNKNLLAKLDNVKDFIAGNENLLSNQKLSGKKVAIISFNEKANVDSVKNALTNSGASIYLDIQIKDEAVNTTNLEKINTKLGQKFTKKEEVISYIANSIKNSSDTSPLASLEELGLVKVRSNSGSYETINSIVVFNGSTVSGKSKFSNLIKPILDQIKEDKYTVAIASSGESVGLKDFSKIKVSTIDNIDEAAGRVSLVDLLASSNIIGNFGNSLEGDKLLPVGK